MLEILAPAGSPEAARAAVMNGANAVYLGFGDFNARRNAKNFTEGDFARITEFCRVRGVKVYVTINTLVSDRELPQALEQAKRAQALGADAVMIQDLGLMRAMREALPSLPLFASTQMSVHDIAGVRKAEELGAKRVVLARELSREEIAYICRSTPLQIEIFCHGALCMCYSGQCYMSSVIGRRSGNRGLCAQPCRMSYSLPGSKNSSYPLSLKDCCLVSRLKDIEKCGVSSLKIEGRMRRPEYSAIVCRIYSRALREGIEPSAQDMEDLKAAFSRSGFTDGYFMNRRGGAMFGVREEQDKREFPVFAEARKTYASEAQIVPVRFCAAVQAGVPARFGVEDAEGRRAETLGIVPQASETRPLASALLERQLSKTGGTPYRCVDSRAVVGDGLFLPSSEINDARRRLLDALTEKRAALPERETFDFEPSKTYNNLSAPPELTFSVMSSEQLSPELCALKPAVLYVPLEELAKDFRRAAPFLENGVTRIAAALPQVFHDDERPEIEKMLDRVRSFGVTDALAGNLGHFEMCRSRGFVLRGGTGLNVFNSETLAVLKAQGLESAALSFELRLSQIRDISKCMDTEAVVYGRLPLMITENCVLKSSSGVCSCSNSPALKDRRGASFPIMKGFGCRNIILNSEKLFLADKRADWASVGLWAGRLAFTTENAKECVLVAARYLGLGEYEPPSRTAALYYRGVE